MNRLGGQRVLNRKAAASAHVEGLCKGFAVYTGSAATPNDHRDQAASCDPFLHLLAGKVSVMRAGPALLPLRPATPSEALLQDPIPEEVVALGDVDMGVTAASGRLVLAAGVLTKLLGGTLAAASSAWLWQGRSFAGSVVPALLTALAASAPQLADHSLHDASQCNAQLRVLFTIRWDGMQVCDAASVSGQLTRIATRNRRLQLTMVPSSLTDAISSPPSPRCKPAVQVTALRDLRRRPRRRQWHASGGNRGGRHRSRLRACCRASQT